MRLTSNPVLHRVLYCVLKQASSAESSFWSDKLLHEILHLCALLLSEETAADPHSLCNAAIGRFGGEGICVRVCVCVCVCGGGGGGGCTCRCGCVRVQTTIFERECLPTISSIAPPPRVLSAVTIVY